MSKLCKKLFFPVSQQLDEMGFLQETMDFFSVFAIGYYKFVINLKFCNAYEQNNLNEMEKWLYSIPIVFSVYVETTKAI